MSIDVEEEKKLMQKISRVLDEARASYATHIRKLKDLSTVRSSSSITSFFGAFSKTLTPLFKFQRRTASAERIVRFVASFASVRDGNNVADCDAFLEEFLRFLIIAASASNKTARFRACQIISEIIVRLPDDTEVSSELWDEVIDCMKLRVGDKVPVIRTFAVRGVSRFASDLENSDVLKLLLQTLSREQNPDVRKTIILSLPPTNATSAAIIDCTLDVSESVRKAAYCVLASKFPLQSLSIKLRTTILQRGLADRSAAVTKECLKLMKDEWLVKSCNGDPIQLLKYLDVETYESVGESVMGALLKAGLVKVQDGQSIKQFLLSTTDTTEGNCTPSIQLMEAEVALYWRTVCKHLQTEAQAKGSDAATTMGTEAAVYASEASDNNELLERILPAAVSDYIELVKAHIISGPNYRFTSRQLLLLGAMLDFSDSTNRRVAGAFVQELLHRPLDYELVDEKTKVVIGDGINLGGDREWADAVSELAKRVHAASGEFEEVVLGVVEELARPCRERTADFMQWMHCLSVTGLLLENTKSFRWMHGKSIEPAELLRSLLLPGAKHVHLDVQRAAIRCLGLFGLLERNPSEEIIKQLRLSFVKGHSTISIMAGKALIDLLMWHGPNEVDKTVNQNLSSELLDPPIVLDPVNLSNKNEDLDIKLLDLLYAGLERQEWLKLGEADENESVQSVIGEGLAKILLLSEKYPSIPTSSHPLFFAKLISLYFCSETMELQRLKQCLSVFFEHYPSLSVNHKASNFYSLTGFPLCKKKIFHGILMDQPSVFYRNRAVQASRFMLQMIQAPLYMKDSQPLDESDSKNSPETLDDSVHPSCELEGGEEGVAIRIAVEAARFHSKKTAAERSYISAICRILVMLSFRPSEQGAIKLMRKLLNRVVESVLTEKELVKELKWMAERLKAIDGHPDQELPRDQANLVLGSLGLETNIDEFESVEIPPTPAPRSTRPTRSRRRARQEEESSSEDETSPTSVVPTNAGMMSTRSQRASKTAPLTKLTAKSKPVKIADGLEEDDEQLSDVTSDDDSDESDVTLE
ncbi:hypothetical protein LguiA_013759 [Lonicera macranthoides]